MSSSITATRHKELLNAQIASSHTIDDILPLFQFVPMNKIQNFLYDQVSNFELNTLRCACCQAVSIMDILPDDIMQFIESFNQDPTHSTVNKKWKEYHENNNRIRLTLRNEAIQNVQFHPNFPFDAIKNKTYLVDQNRIFRNSPIPTMCQNINAFHYFQDALIFCNPGDRMVVCDGNYVLCKKEDINNLQIIGIGNNVRFITFTDENVEYTGEELFSIKQNVYFENIIYEGIINLYGGANLFMKDCKCIFSNVGVHVRTECSLYAENCEFIGGSIGIDLSPYSNQVTVIKCLFKHCGHEQEFTNPEECACISVEDSYSWRLRGTDVDKRNCVTLKCIGNTFENNVCYPIAERHPPHHTSTHEAYFVLDRNKIEIRNNCLRGYNGTEIKNKLKKCDVMDGNTIYYNDSIAQYHYN